jgi:hypothetical protein
LGAELSDLVSTSSSSVRLVSSPLTSDKPSWTPVQNALYNIFSESDITEVQIWFHYTATTTSNANWLIEYIKRIWLVDGPLMVAVVKSEPL